MDCESSSTVTDLKCGSLIAVAGLDGESSAPVIDLDGESPAPLTDLDGESPVHVADLDGESPAYLADLDRTERYYRTLNESLKQKTATLIRQAEQALQHQLDVSEGVDLGAEVDSALEDDDSTLAGSVQGQGDNVLDPFPDVDGEDNDDEQCTAVDDTALDSSARKMNARSQARFYRASFRAASSQVQRLNGCVSAARDQNAQLQLRIRQLEADAAGSRAAGQKLGDDTERLKRSHARVSDELRQSRVEIDALQRQLGACERELCAASAKAVQSDAQVRRLGDERSRLRADLAELEKRRAGEVSDLREQLRKQEEANRLLERQRQELVVGFRKQLKLIDVLKRQRVHLQAAKLLQISEQQFLKVMDLSLKG